MTDLKIKVLTVLPGGALCVMIGTLGGCEQKSHGQRLAEKFCSEVSQIRSEYGPRIMERKMKIDEAMGNYFVQLKDMQDINDFQQYATPCLR